MDICCFCGHKIEENEYRHRFPVFLPQEIHGSTLVIAEREATLNIHAECAIMLGKSLIGNGASLAGPAKSQKEFSESVRNWLEQF